ncbi:MAG TPA: amidohydrolase family protein [bacterium]|nr:amidohydrolase family protein [bacterium]
MITINGCRIIPMDGPVIEQGAIQIEGTKVHAILRSPVAIGGDEVIDARGLTAIPGMGQMHGHFSGYMHTMDVGPVTAQPHTLKAIQAAAFARNALHAGITMWREVGAHAHIDLQLKKAINLGLIPGPRMQAAGRWLGHSGGHGSGLSEEVDGPAALREAVRAQVAAGADGIKLIASGGVMQATEDPFRMEYTAEELAAGVEEAHRAGKWVAVHSHPAGVTRAAVKAGVQSIEHATEMPDDVIELLLKHDVWIVPTFAAYWKLSREGGEIGLAPTLVASAYRVWDRKMEYFMRAVQAGVKFATGTDTGAPRVFHHDLALELELMVQIGLTPEQTLRAATVSCAQLMGWSDSLGTLSPGKEADVVLLEGNPLVNISATRQVRHIFKAGMHYTPEPPVPPLPW